MPILAHPPPPPRASLRHRSPRLGWQRVAPRGRSRPGAVQRRLSPPGGGGERGEGGQEAGDFSLGHRAWVAFDALSARLGREGRTTGG